MKPYVILPRIKLFELYAFLNRENRSNDRAIALLEIDMTKLDEARQKHQASDLKPTYTAFIAKAAALVLKEMPNANRATVEWPFFKRIYQFNNYHVSVAVEREDAFQECSYEAAFIYTVFEADQKSVPAISSEIAGLAKLPLDSTDSRLERWQKMKFGTSKFPFLFIVKLVVWFQKNFPASYIKNRGGALMISSPGKYGIDCIVAHWPYTLGLSFGLAKRRPWVVNGELAVSKTMHITLAFDRRVISGSLAARFLNRLCQILEDPQAHFELD